MEYTHVAGRMHVYSQQSQTLNPKRLYFDSSRNFPMRVNRVLSETTYGNISNILWIRRREAQRGSHVFQRIDTFTKRDPCLRKGYHFCFHGIN